MDLPRPAPYRGAELVLAPLRKDLSLTHPETIEIAARYNGPPGSANGGYAAGVCAALDLLGRTISWEIVLLNVGER